MSPELPLTSGETSVVLILNCSTCTSLAVGSKSQAPCTNSMATAVVPVSQPSNSGETPKSSGSQRVESSEPEALGMEIEDVARQQLTLLRSLQQAESSTHSEHELHMYTLQQDSGFFKFHAYVKYLEIPYTTHPRESEIELPWAGFESHNALCSRQMVYQLSY